MAEKENNKVKHKIASVCLRGKFVEDHLNLKTFGSVSFQIVLWNGNPWGNTWKFMRLGNSGNGFEENLSHFTSTNGATENFCQSSTTPMKRKVCPISMLYMDRFMGLVKNMFVFLAGRGACILWMYIDVLVLMLSFVRLCAILKQSAAWMMEHDLVLKSCLAASLPFCMIACHVHMPKCT